METPIFDFVRRYAQKEPSRLHMPGHKGTGPLGCEQLDITEISGADSLYEAQGVIAASEQNAAKLFCSGRTFYSAGGTSQCLKAMLCLVAGASQGKTILAARNAHKAFVHAAALLDLDVQWLWPEEYSLLRCHVTAAQLERRLAGSSRLPAAVYVTSPDYLGHMQPVDELARVCHRYGVPLLVDNAHGAYLHFLPHPVHPLDLGADFCCDSAHKTLPVLTGGAYFHLAACQSGIGDVAVRQALAMFGSTSPSYLILQSLDLCNASLAGEFPARLAQTVERVDALKERLRHKGWRVEQSEPLKIVVRTDAGQGTGRQLACELRRHGAECEYADAEHLVLMASPYNKEQDFVRVEQAFSRAPSAGGARVSCGMLPPQRAMSIRQAMFSPWEEIEVEKAEGRVCAAPTVSCPPAVPVVVSGEVIRADAIRVMRHYGVCTVCVVQ